MTQQSPEEIFLPHLAGINHMSISHLVRLDICGKESADSSPDVPSL